MNALTRYQAAEQRAIVRLNRVDETHFIDAEIRLARALLADAHEQKNVRLQTDILALIGNLCKISEGIKLRSGQLISKGTLRHVGARLADVIKRCDSIHRCAKLGTHRGRRAGRDGTGH